MHDRDEQVGYSSMWRCGELFNGITRDLGRSLKTRSHNATTKKKGREHFCGLLTPDIFLYAMRHGLDCKAEWNIFHLSDEIFTWLKIRISISFVALCESITFKHLFVFFSLILNSLLLDNDSVERFQMMCTKLYFCISRFSLN